MVTSMHFSPIREWHTIQISKCQDYIQNVQALVTYFLMAPTFFLALHFYIGMYFDKIALLLANQN